jgi:hypothetical protein
LYRAETPPGFRAPTDLKPDEIKNVVYCRKPVNYPVLLHFTKTKLSLAFIGIPFPGLSLNV